MDQTLGMIGLGRMGAPMAARLLGAGHVVLGFDRAGTMERLPPGARAAESVAALTAEARVIFLSLPDGAACLAVCDELVATPAWQGRPAVVNLSTVGVPTAEACASRMGAAGIASLDAPVSGGVAGAVSGGLAMMVGGDADLYVELRPLLLAIARNCFRVGDRAGQGQAMKLLNNYVSAAAMVATSEAVLCGTRLGLDPDQVVEILNVSSGRTTASTDKFPRSVLPRSFDFGFAGALMTKDVALYLEQAERAEAPREVAIAVTRLWERFNRACPGEDFTAIYRYLEGGD
jgi:3-hydroxyisobutyrate dehydrogenase